MATAAPVQSAPFSPPATVAEVANEFLKLAEADPVYKFVDQMKLQKLLFYAHAWHLAYDKGPLFENDFEAWPWGPVVRAVYTQTVNCGRNAIREPIWELGSGSQGYDFVTPGGVDEALKPFIRSVWESLKTFNGVQLSNSTHADGEPWTIVSQKIGTTSKPVIPNDLIEEVFKKKLQAG